MLADPERFTPVARERLVSAEHELYLSAASAWEIATKSALGRLHLPMDPAEYVRTRLLQSHTIPLVITHEHALRVASLPAHHRDPFDRLLIAQAQLEGLVVMTSDGHFSRYEVDVISP
jgi:PIN domain nuclease of toxin-antitoxin system